MRRALIGTVWSLTLVAVLSSVTFAQQAFQIAVFQTQRQPSLNGSVDESWTKAIQVPVTFDFTYQRTGEPATAYI
jgi:hypothetical protein